MRPQTTVDGVDAYPDVHTKAAALVESLIQNHPFVDGNKRTAFLAAVTFYGINGYELDMPTEEAVQFVLDIATHELTGVEEIARSQVSYVRVPDSGCNIEALLRS